MQLSISYLLITINQRIKFYFGYLNTAYFLLKANYSGINIGYCLPKNFQKLQDNVAFQCCLRIVKGLQGLNSSKRRYFNPTINFGRVLVLL